MKATNFSQHDARGDFAGPPEYLTKSQFAHRLAVSIRTVDALMKAKKVPYLKLTRKLVRFRRQDVDDYLARNFRVHAVGE